MDESWRMPMGITSTSTTPRRKSTDDSLHPEDFHDVFGGPPRTILNRQYSSSGASEFPNKTFFYEDIFRQPEKYNAARNGRSLPAFRIPANGVGGRRGNEFYNDVFGMDFEEVRRSRSRSKSKYTTSSSVLSDEEFAPFRPGISKNDDVLFSAFASKLRPINVESKCNLSVRMHELRQRQQSMSEFSCSRPSFAEKEYTHTHTDIKNSSTQFGISRRFTSPETMSLEPNSYGSLKVSVKDLEVKSPNNASPVSSLCQQHEGANVNNVQDGVMQQQEDDNDDDDDIVSSYIIEISSDHKVESDEALGEAIAWAKERYRSHSSLEELSIRQHEQELLAEARGRSAVLRFPDGHGSLNLKREMESLDEDIRLWSSGKESNIQLLLSTLHDILWPNSGWFALPLIYLNESSNVKKAYQKARMCLHPDKLQQRGATLPQKYVAQKAFPILQDAWAAFITKDHHLSSKIAH